MNKTVTLIKQEEGWLVLFNENGKPVRSMLFPFKPNTFKDCISLTACSNIEEWCNVIPGCDPTLSKTSKKKIIIPWNKKVYIIEPRLHGNGGWCGSKTFGTLPFKKALKINPFGYFKKRYYDSEWGSLGWIRMCFTENPNDSIYMFNPDDSRWETTS